MTSLPDMPNPESELARAVDYGEFHLAYQPMVSVRDGAMVFVEALLRWDHPRHGLLWPGQFLDETSTSPVQQRLSRWVLTDAARWSAHWRRRYPEQPIAVSVNVAEHELDEADLAVRVSSALNKVRLDPPALALEIKESWLLEDLDRSRDRLGSLDDLGVQLFVDNVGSTTGDAAATIEALAGMPIDVVKLDRRVMETCTDGLSASRADGSDSDAAALIALAHRLGFRVLAEGVEQASQAEQLRLLGCDLAQGYHFHRPQPREYVDVLLREARSERVKRMRASMSA